ncbi:MAG: S8 family serine peptidase [Bacteroidota bacterium]
MMLRPLFFAVSLLISFQTVSAQARFAPHVDPKNAPLQFMQRYNNPDSMVQVIVEFREMPMFLKQQNSFAAVSTASYESRFAEFENDLRAIVPQSTVSFQKSAAMNTHRFYKAFFGMSAVLPQGMVSAVEQLPYVKKVHQNKKVKAYLYKSVPQIRANEVWSNYGVTGEGVVVGIIDTGIDYLHPALGGGIGASFKVIGGYDFANQDNDPMDDNGHGTHVAGIVAADAADIKGVAPKVKLYAFKVLNTHGSGTMDDIIAAIERTVDPNNDGDMSDRLDIVNMSLGSDNGDPDDAASIAVDNATTLGVTFCIAAGNDGQGVFFEGKENNYYYSGMETIGSPGTSRLAITVGAVDSNNTMAYFSSKGPTPGYFGIKPDVTAPGVMIRSLFPGGTIETESGTSMASPMIAGVAALLKSKDKSLTPQQIKSRIVNSSVDLAVPVNVQGAGRVDAMRAIAQESYAVPTQFSFGLDDPSQTNWIKVETVKVTNTKSISQNYTVAFTGTKSGIGLLANPQNFSLTSGGTQQVLVTVSVNNALIPIVDEDIILYGGFAHITGDSDTLHLPWSFARTTRTYLTFSDPNAQFVGSSATRYLTSYYHKMYSRTRWIDATTVEVTGAINEPYDFAVLFSGSSKLVLKGDVPFTGNGMLAFNSADAVYHVSFDGVDNNNVPLSSSLRTKRALRVAFPYGFLFTPLANGLNSISVSPAPAKFEFMGIEALLDVPKTKRVVIPQYASFKGISSDVQLTNDPAAYVQQKLQFTMPDGVTKTRMFSDVVSSQLVAGDSYFNTVLVAADTLDVPDGMTSFDLYLMKPVDPIYTTSVAFHTNSTFATDFYLDMSTRYLSVVNDSVLMGFPSQNWLTAYKSPSGGTVRFGEAPIHILNLSYNNSFGPSIHFSPMFFGSLGENRYSDLNVGKYSIYDGSGALRTSDALNNFPRYPYMTDPAKYSLVIEANGYRVKNAKGKITLTNSFDLTKPVPDAPILTSFALYHTNGIQGNNFAVNEDVKLKFSSKVFSFPEQLPVADSTKVFYRKFKTSGWTPLTVIAVSSDLEKEGTIFSASLSPATAEDSVAIDLKIRIVDETGNSTEQILSPAFSVGNWLDDGTSGVDEGKTLTPETFALYQNYPNPFNPATTIGFDVPQYSPIQLTVFDMLGREVATLVNEHRPAGRYTVKFNAQNISSGVYFYRLSIGAHSALKRMVLVK